MKKTTKILTVLLAVAMLLSLAACGGGKGSGTDIPDPSDTPEASNTDVPSEGELVTAVKGVLTMATNATFPPYEYYEGDNIVGIDAEIAKAIADKLGLELNIQDMEFDSTYTSAGKGKADIAMAGLSMTPEREEIVAFSDSYATGIQVVIVTEDSDITSVDDLFAEGASHTIGVQRNTTGDIYTTGDIEDAGLGTIDRYSKGADAIMALKTGKVDCVVIDNEPAKVFVAENEGLKLLDTEYVEEEYAIGMSKTNTALFDAVNNALKELLADGTVAAIIEKYIPTK